MPTPQFPAVSDNASLVELTDAYVAISRYLTYLLSALDTLNISRLDAKVIIAETITTDKIQAGAVTTDKIDAGAVTTDKLDAGAVTADKIQANAVTTDKIQAGAVTADKITVSQLSAISANLGTITAGSLTTNAQINVGTDATIGDNLYLNASSVGDKAIIFNSGSGTDGRIASQSGDMSITAGGFITFTIGSSQGMVVNQTVHAPVFNASTAVTVNNQPVAMEAAAGRYLTFDAGTRTLSLLNENLGLLSSVVIP